MPEDVMLPTWRCPICEQQPQGDNFRIQLVETRAGLALIDWIRGDTREGLFCIPEGQVISSVEDMLGHITVFEGCSACFSKECEKNPLARSLFKLLWHLLKQHNLPHPKHGGHWIKGRF